MKILPISYNGLNNRKNAKTTQSGKPKTSNFGHKKFLIPIVVVAGATIAICSSQNTNNVGNKPVSIPFDSKKTSIEDVAKTYNTSETAIKTYNSIPEDAQLSDITELKLPYSFDYISDEIKKEQMNLYSNSLSPEERTSLEDKISFLFEKQKEQKAVADVYSDGTDLYITINIKNDELSEKLQDKYQFGINIESLKKLFDIKDGAIEENNDISAKWVSTNQDGTKGYYDYTLNWFKNGDVIKVPLNSINTGSIDLSAYSK